MTKKKFFLISLCVSLPVIAGVIIVCCLPLMKKNNDAPAETPPAPESIIWDANMLNAQTGFGTDGELFLEKPVPGTEGISHVLSIQCDNAYVGSYITKEYLAAIYGQVNFVTFRELYGGGWNNFDMKMELVLCDEFGDNKTEPISLNLTGPTYQGFTASYTTPDNEWQFIYSVTTTYIYKSPNTMMDVIR